MAGETEAVSWPALSREAGRDTWNALQLWSQIPGKVRLAVAPWVNHSGHATHYVTTRGLTTSTIPYAKRPFRIDFDFIDHQVLVQTADGAERRVTLAPQSVATFHAKLMAALAELELDVRIHGTPNEVPDAVPFTEDRKERAYDPDAAHALWRAFLQIDRVFSRFRTGFVGKVSPVHLFWGSFDLAVTRFSGRRAPLHPGGIPNLPDEVTREAYSHEVSSAGFWPGGNGVEYPAFYSYAYPAPKGFADAPVGPNAAFYEQNLGEFVLPYDAVQSAANPDQALLEFLQTTYEAAANNAGWPRAELECPFGMPLVPRPI
jgi:hypothetical protein